MSERGILSLQVGAVGQSEDGLVGISPTHDTWNIVDAVGTVKLGSLVTEAITCEGGDRIERCAPNLFEVGSRDTARIQDLHILAECLLSDRFELDLVPRQTSPSKPLAEIREENLP